MAEFKVGDTVHWHFLDKVVEQVLDEGDHAVLFSHEEHGCGREGCVSDVAQYWETTENFVLNSGYTAVVVQGSEQLFTGSVEDEQRMVDHWRALFADCWGVAP